MGTVAMFGHMGKLAFAQKSHSLVFPCVSLALPELSQNSSRVFQERLEVLAFCPQQSTQLCGSRIEMNLLELSG